ncbi:hypothetical protein, partial [Escherichia coli]|uniref:hypothetical protein n=1 Tax=Escherichia coli TaxID=562 RepID=UPI001BC86087
VAFCAAVRLSRIELKSRPDPTPSDEILAMRFPFIFRHVKRIPGLSALIAQSLRLIVFFNSGNKGQRKEYFGD